MTRPPRKASPFRLARLPLRLEWLEDRTTPANLALFFDPAYVETTNATPQNAEAAELRDSLQSLGHTVTTFTGITAAAFSAALAGQDALVIPELAAGTLATDLSAAAETVISDFVGNGGGLIINREISDDDLDLLNGVFGFTIADGGTGASTLQAAAAAGTRFADGPAALLANGTTDGFVTASLPSGSKAIYTEAVLGDALVALIPFGQGEIVGLGWDWNNALPAPGTQDGGWLDVLDRAVLQLTETVDVFLDADGNLIVRDFNSANLLLIQADVANSEYVIVSGGGALVTTIAGATGSGTDTVTVPFAQVTGSQITVNGLGGGDELLVGGSLADFPDDLFFVGGNGNDILHGPDDATAYVVTGGPDAGTFGTTGLFSQIENLVGRNQADTFTLNNTLSGSINGGGGSDTLIGGGGFNSWDITGANTGIVNGLGGTFASIENLTGGPSIDFFDFAVGGSVSGTIDGGGDSDLLIYDSFATPVRANLGLGTAGLEATLGPDQEVPPTSSSAGGTATVSNYDPATRTFDITVTVTDLDPADVTGFHIHRQAVGANGPVIINLQPLGTLTPTGTGFTFTATGVTLPADQEAAFLGGVTYVNVHTAAFPGGAIRGQLFSTGNVNLTTGAATATGGVTNVESVLGGSEADSLVGSFGANFLSGDGGNDTILGAPGNDTMQGGDDDDVLVWSNGDGSDIIDGSSGADTVQVNGRIDGTDDFTISAGAGGRIDFQRAAPGPFSLDIGTTETLTVNGIGGDDSFTVNDLTGVADLTALNLNGFAGSDTFDFTDVVPVAIAFNVHGGTGTDTLIGPAVGATFNITGPGAGDVDGQPGQFQFVENLTGGTADDEFVFSGSGSVGGVIDGGGGINILDYSALTTAVSANLGLGSTGLEATLGPDQEVPPTASAASGTATISNYDPATRTFDITVTVDGIAPGDVTGFHIHRQAVGANGPVIIDLQALGTLTPSGTGFTFTVTGVSLPAEHEAAFLGGLTYVNVHTAAFPTGVIRGQLFSTGNVNLPTGTATATGGIANIQNVTGGSGADSLVGNFGINVLSGNGGGDTILGAPGNDTMLGGDDDDTMIWGNGDNDDLIEGGIGADTVQVNGAAGAGDEFAVAANGTRLDFDRANLVPFSLDVGTSETLTVNGIGGNDTIVVGDLSGVADVTALRLFGQQGDDTIDASAQANAAVSVSISGGSGNDTFLGSPQADLIDGGPGNDLAVGGKGADQFFGRDGDDTFVWNPGDGSDLVEGQAGTDILVFNGSAAAEVFTLQNSGGRFELLRNLGNVDMDVAGTERVELDMLGGADAVTVNDLTGTGVAEVAIDLGLADAAADAVTVAGTSGADVLTLTSPVAGEVLVDGQSYNVQLTSVGATEDALTVDAGAGADTVDASAVPAGVFASVELRGSSEDDTLLGTQGADVILGGSGNDTAVGNKGADQFFGDVGDDLFVWNNGDGSDLIEGEAGSDTVQVNGAPTGDNFIVAPNGTRVRFDRTNLIPFTLDIGTSEALEVNGGDGADTFDVTPLASTGVEIDGGPPTTSPGDTLQVDVGGASSPVLPPVGQSSGQFTFGDRAAVVFTGLESITPTLGVGQDAVSQFAVGAGAGGSSQVTVFNPDQSVALTIDAFPGFVGGVRVAVADVNGDGTPDLIVGTGPGGPTQVRVIDGKTQAELFSVQPFEASFTGGVFVAAGDVTGDGKADLVITPDEGGGPRVRIFSGDGFGLLADFFGIEDSAFRGGARPALADVTGDGVADLLVAAGFGGGPRIAVFDGTSLATGTPTKPFGDFFVFEDTLRNGVFIASGDLNGDGFAEVIAGGGPGGGPRVFALSGQDLLGGTQTTVANFFAGDTENRGGIRVVAKDLDGDVRADLVVGAGEDAGSRVTAYAGSTIPVNGTPPELFAFDAFPGFTGGVFVG